MKPTRDGEGVDVNKTSMNLTYPNPQIERDKVEEIRARLAEANNTGDQTALAVLYNRAPHDISFLLYTLTASEKRAEEWFTAALGALADSDVPTPANAREEFTPGMMAGDIRRLARDRDEARSSLVRVREEILAAAALRFKIGAIATCLTIERVAGDALSPHPERENG